MRLMAAKAWLHLQTRKGWTALTRAEKAGAEAAAAGADDRELGPAKRPGAPGITGDTAEAASRSDLKRFDPPPPPFCMPPDIRWQQRFANFCRALERLEDFFRPPPLNEREQQGLIKAFEYCYELGWNTLRDLLRSEGNADLIGSRDTL